MAERLPVGAARNIKSSSLSLGFDLACNDVSSPPSDQLNGHAMNNEPDLNESNNLLFSNGSGVTCNRGLGHNKQGHSDATSRHGSRTKDGESRHEAEWVEQDELGVYITLTSLQGGGKDLKRVRFRYVGLQLSVRQRDNMLSIAFPCQSTCASLSSSLMLRKNLLMGRIDIGEYRMIG